MNMRRVAVTIILVAAISGQALPQAKIPPYDLWTGDVLSAIRNRSTLEISIIPQGLYSDVFFTSNASADWYESSPPYAVHHGDKIRIHAIVAAPPLGGPYPALVLGHGHGGRADRDLTLAIAGLGYVAIFIDGPQAGQSTGGPRDENQAWISIDSGPNYGYLYHYAYAGMRTLTLLEALASLPGNPFRIDTQKFGVVGASMGGIFATYLNGIDSRVKAAVILASAGSWHHTLRYPNSWLYHGIYAGTRDLPYNGTDPENSIENVDTDATALNFVNYFDPIRYAPRQYAPVLTVIGTHDEYFPMPNANLMLQAITSAGARTDFEKRLWLLPNAPHQFDLSFQLIDLVIGLRQWLEYSFGNRARPLATPQVALSAGSNGLRFDITLPEPRARLADAHVVLYAATRIDSTIRPISDFTSYLATLEGDRFVVQIPKGDKTSSGTVIGADNVLYYTTATDSSGLPVSSLMYKGAAPIDLSTNFVPAIEVYPDGKPASPVPPPYADAAVTAAGSLPVAAHQGYQGMALTNATDNAVAVRVEARNPEGRLAAAEGLINPVFIPLPPRSQQVFLPEQWLGAGARDFSGTFQAGWSSTRTGSLALRGNVDPAELEGIGPAGAPSKSLWLPLAPEQDPAGARRIRIFSTSAEAADVSITFRNKFGNQLAELTVIKLAGKGMAEVPVELGANFFEKSSATIVASAPVSARLETLGGKDPWSIEAQPAPTTNKLILPHVEWNGTFATRLLMLNTSSTAALDLRFSLHPSTRQDVPQVFQIINPNSTASLTIESLFGFGPSGLGQDPGEGWLEVEAPGSQVVIVALAVDQIRRASAASGLVRDGTSSWSLPFFVENSGYYTGLALANTGNEACGVTITAYNPGGSVLGRYIGNLEPRQNRTLLIHEWIPVLAKGATGYIQIASTAPVAPLAFCGTTDGAALAAIPLTPGVP